MSAQDHPHERRKNTRRTLELDAELTLSDKLVCKGKTRNLSFSGVYFSCANARDIPLGEVGFLTLFIKSDPAPHTVSCTCRVIRTDDYGAGLVFVDIDLEGYQTFKQLMVYNSDDPDKLLEELKQSPGLVIKKG
jgi:hypothetical protein